MVRDLATTIRPIPGTTALMAIAGPGLLLGSDSAIPIAVTGAAGEMISRSAGQNYQFEAQGADVCRGS